MGEYDDHTLALAAEYLFSHPKATPREIRDRLRSFGIEIGAHAPFNRLIPELIDRKWVRLFTPRDHALDADIKSRYRQLEDVTVTRTSYIDDMASHTAYKIRDLITEIAQKQDNIHVGFSGGHTTRRVFRELVNLLCEPAYKLSSTKSLYCHALVAGFDNEAPGTDPNSFFTYLDDCPTLFKKRFFLLHAPAFVRSRDLQDVLNLPTVKEAEKAAAKLDLIVASVASFRDAHSQLRKHYEKHHRATLKDLEDSACQGDMLWLPINNEGPIAYSADHDRPVTLLELDDLPDRIGSGSKVVLVVGPCADPDVPCKNSKASLLSCVLNLQSRGGGRYLTHLIVDGSTARELIQASGTSQSAA